MIWVVLLLAAAVAVLFLCNHWRRSARREPVETAENTEPPRSSPAESLDMPVEEECPRCGATWWPGGLCCWNCDYDTRADDSES